MAKDLQLVLYDPVTDTKVTWDLEGEERFGIMLKTAIGEIVNAIARKTRQNPIKVMTEQMRMVVIRIEPKTKGQT